MYLDRLSSTGGASVELASLSVHVRVYRADHGLMFSDVPTGLRRRHIDEQWDIYREIGIWNLTIPVDVTPAAAIVAALRRSSRTFSEEDRLLATLMRPHLCQAYGNAQAYSNGVAGTV